MEQNIVEFHKSISGELESIKNRVRNLIGDKHWLSDGKYKEDVLRNVISRFLPKIFSVGTGFILTNEKELSTEIDIIIYENAKPLLFSQGDFVIVTADSVRAIIEVKVFAFPSIGARIHCCFYEKRGREFLAGMVFDEMHIFRVRIQMFQVVYKFYMK